MKRKQALLALSGLFLLSLAGCNPTPEANSGASSASTEFSSSQQSSSIEHVHKYVAHPEVEATCASEGTGAYYSCSDCSKIFDASKKEIDKVPTLPKDPNNHKGTPSFVYSGVYKNTYAVGDIFSLGEAVYKIKCEDCEGTALTENQAKNVKYTYPTEGASAFTAKDVGSDKKVVAKYGNYEPITFVVTVAKRVTTIEGIKDIDAHCGFAAFKELGYVTPSEGEVVYTFSDKQDGEYLTADEFNEAHPQGMTVGGDEATSKTYYAKAAIEGTDEYEGASKSFLINITHQGAEDIKWGESADGGSDIYGCPDKTPISFDKTVDLDNQDILLNDQAEGVDYSLDLTGVGEFKEIKSIKYGDYDLGTDVTKLNIGDDLKKDLAKHGKGIIEVTVHSEAKNEAPETDHLIKVPVTFVTKEIASVDDFKTWVTATSENLIIDGYYKQTADVIAPARNGLSGWNDYFVGTYDGNGKAITFHSNSYGPGLFGNNLGKAGSHATIKNLTINDGWHADGMDNVLLGKAIWDTTFENVKFTLAVSRATGYAWNSGWLASQRVQNVSFKDCTFACTGLAMRSILGGHKGNYSNITFANSVLTVDSYWCLWNEKASNADVADTEDKVTEAEGLAITTGAKQDNAISGLEDNYNEHCGFKAFSALDGVKATAGEITYTFSKSEDGDYVSAEDFAKNNPSGMVVSGNDASTIYYGKASVVGASKNGVSYSDVSKAFTITITHAEGLVWNTTGEDYDTYGKCACKNEEPIKFSKKVTATNQDVDLNATEDQKISLDGIGAYESVKSIKYGDYDLGSDASKLIFPDALKTDYEKHGAGELTVVVHSAASDDVPEIDHTIKVPVTILTKAIGSKEDLKNYVQLSSTNTEVKGYFKQTQSISIAAEGSGFDWGYHFIGTYDGNGNTITANGSGLTNGIFGQLGINNTSTSEIQAIVKNLTVVDQWYNGGGSHAMLAKSIWNTSFENVTVKNNGSGTSATGKFEENNGWLSYSRCRNTKFSDCTFEATGIALGTLLGGSIQYTDSITFENCSLKAKSYICIYFKGAVSSATKVTEAKGLTIEADLTETA